MIAGQKRHAQGRQHRRVCIHGHIISKAFVHEKKKRQTQYKTGDQKKECFSAESGVLFDYPTKRERGENHCGGKKQK